MDASTIGVIVALIMSVLSVGGMAVFGAKNLFSGKHEMQKIVVLVVPFLTFGVAYFVTGSADEAAIITTVIMVAFMALLVTFSALKSVFNL